MPEKQINLMESESSPPVSAGTGLEGGAVAKAGDQPAPHSNVLNGTLTFEMSPTIGALVGALAKARKKFNPVLKSEVNPFFKSKYADLANVIEATKDSLSDNGLAVVQPPSFSRQDGLVRVLTLLAHSSGEWMKAILDMPVTKTDAQAVGSAITYGRRYSYSAILNVASEQDDDANAAVSKDFKRQEESPESFDQRTLDQQNIGPAQIQAIDEAIKRTGKSEEEVVAALSFIGEKRIEHIKKSQFDKFLKWANGTKKADPVAAKAMKKLFAAAGEFGIPENDVKRASYEKFGVKSMTELNAAQLTQMEQWVLDVAKNIQEA